LFAHCGEQEEEVEEEAGVRNTKKMGTGMRRKRKGAGAPPPPLLFLAIPVPIFFVFLTPFFSSSFSSSFFSFSFFSFFFSFFFFFYRCFYLVSAEKGVCHKQCTEVVMMLHMLGSRRLLPFFSSTALTHQTNAFCPHPLSFLLHCLLHPCYSSAL